MVYEYSGSDEEMNEITDYVATHFSRMSRECRECLKMNVYFYFVPRELYDPIDYAVSRERAVAVFRHLSTNESPQLEQIEP